MNDDTNGTIQSNWLAEGEQKPMTRDDWEVIPSDPDDETDLGYTYSDWESFETLDGTNQVMFLPSDEESLKDSAFVVTNESDIISLENNC